MLFFLTLYPWAINIIFFSNSETKRCSTKYTPLPKYSIFYLILGAVLSRLGAYTGVYPRGGFIFFLSRGALHPLGRETPLETIDFIYHRVGD